MPANEYPPAWSAVPALAAVRAIAEVRRRFDRLRPTLGHALRVASSQDLLECHPAPGQARCVPCAWGVRRDEYRWDLGNGGRQDVAPFRVAAAAAAIVLHCHYRSDAWAGLLPGTMGEVLGTRSDLYLADYWALVLHHLVWTGRLPYPARARWLLGDGGEPGPYHLVSELPTDPVEASREALILFEEAAVAGPAGVASGCAAGEAPCGLPVRRGGRWGLVVPGRSPVPPATAAEPARHTAGPAEAVAAPAAHPPSPDPEPDGPAAGDDAEAAGPAIASLRLDDQTFTVRHGAGWYRFPPPSKLLFALLDRVARRPGHRVDFDDLRTIGDVWDGSSVEDSTVRGAVARLRGVLEKNDMGGLAARIQTGTYRGRGYVLLDTSGAPDADK